MTAQWIRFRILHELIACWSESCDPRLARAQAVFKNMATYRHPARLPGYREPQQSKIEDEMSEGN